MARTTSDRTDTRELKSTSVTDPATNAAVSTAIIDQFSAVIITTTGASNAQTLQDPTNVTNINRFTVMNNDTSTNAITVNGDSLAAGEQRAYVWDGTAWLKSVTGGAGGGDVTKVGTPVDDQVGVWTGDGTIEGTTGLTYDGSNFQLTGDIGSTGTRITKGWFVDLEVTNAIAGSITGNAATVTTITGLAPDTATTQATQPNITSLGTLTTLTVDDITINGNAISSGGASALTITALAGQSVTVESVTHDGGAVGGVTTLAMTGALSGATTGAFTAASSLTLGTASSAAGGIIFQNATNANTFTMQTGVTSTSYTITWPLAVAGAGEVLTDAAGDGVLSWAAGGGGGLAWGDSITDTTGDGTTWTLGDNFATGNRALKITANVTQNATLRYIELDTTPNVSTTNIGMVINTFRGIGLRMMDAAVAALSGASTGIQVDPNGAWNTSSTVNSVRLTIVNPDNASSGVNTGINLTNAHTAISGVTSAVDNGAGLGIDQNGVDGTALQIRGANNILCATNGMINYTLTNTQSGASVVQKIDLGTSSAAHTGLLVNAFGASSTQKGINVELSSTGLGFAMEIGNASTTNISQKGLFINLLGDNNSRHNALDIEVTGGATNATGSYCARFDNPAVTTTGVFINKLTSGGRDSILVDAASATSSTAFKAIMGSTTIDVMDLQCDGLTSASIARFASNSASTTARNLLEIVNDNTAAVNVIPLFVQQDAVTSTNFKKCIEIAGFTIWISDGTTAEGALTGVAGDIVLNGGTGAGQTAYCDANGTNWTDM